VAELYDNSSVLQHHHFNVFWILLQLEARFFVWELFLFEQAAVKLS